MKRSDDYVYISESAALEPDVEVFDVGIAQNQLDSSPILKVFLIRVSRQIEIERKIVTAFNISETGDSFPNKVCDRCFKHLDTSEEFSNNRHKKGGFVTKRPSCKQCRKEKDGASIASSERRAWDANKPEDYTLFACPICQKTTIAGISRIVLDHNHSTGGVRGWICESCNTGIGRFDDNPKILERGIDWLNGL